MRSRANGERSRAGRCSNASTAPCWRSSSPPRPGTASSTCDSPTATRSAMAARSSAATIASSCRSRPSTASTRSSAPTSTITAGSTCPAIRSPKPAAPTACFELGARHSSGAIMLPAREPMRRRATGVARPRRKTSGLLTAWRHRRLVGLLARLLGAERVLHGADVLAQAVLQRRDLVLDLLVGRLLLVDLILERLDLRLVGARRGGRRRRRRQLHGDVHDRPIEQVPAEAEAGGDQKEASQQAAQDEGPARDRALFRRQWRRVGHGGKVGSGSA